MNASLAASYQDTDTASAGALSKRGQKAEDAYRTISEVADDLHVAQHVLRFWESKFKQIEPLKRAGGRRYYRREDVDLLKRIHFLLYNQGYTIKGVQKLLVKDRNLMHAVPQLPEDKKRGGANQAPAATGALANPTMARMPSVNMPSNVATELAAIDASPELAHSGDQLNLFAASDRVVMNDILRRLKKIHDYLNG